MAGAGEVIGEEMETDVGGLAQNGLVCGRCAHPDCSVDAGARDSDGCEWCPKHWMLR